MHSHNNQSLSMPRHMVGFGESGESLKPSWFPVSCGGLCLSRSFIPPPPPPTDHIAFCLLGFISTPFSLPLCCILSGIECAESLSLAWLSYTLPGFALFCYRLYSDRMLLAWLPFYLCLVLYTLSPLSTSFTFSVTHSLDPEPSIPPPYSSTSINPIQPSTQHRRIARASRFP